MRKRRLRATAKISRREILDYMRRAHSGEIARLIWIARLALERRLSVEARRWKRPRPR